MVDRWIPSKQGQESAGRGLARLEGNHALAPPEKSQHQSPRCLRHLGSVTSRPGSLQSGRVLDGAFGDQRQLNDGFGYA